VNYKLAKQLKDAGFSQKPKSEFPLWLAVKGKEPVQVPSLSELIEACGCWIDLHVRSKMGSQARALNHFSKFKKWVGGKTSKEAVAKLWLELNK